MAELRRSVVRPVTLDDYEWLLDLHRRAEVIGSGQALIANGRPEAAIESLWHDVFCQFVVQDQASGERRGILVGYGLNDRCRVASMAVIFSRRGRSAIADIEALEWFIDLLFYTYRLRKVYFDVAERHLYQMESTLRRVARHEVQYPEAELVEGSWQSRHVFALYEDEWDVARPSARVATALGKREAVAGDIA